LLLLPSPGLFAWDGYDYESDSYIEIKDKDSILSGNDVVIFDHSDGFYHEVYVISVNRNGAVIIEVFDYDAGDYREFEMMDETKSQDAEFFRI
jgi:hypothetical protein